jgi:hypothetical protein
MIVTDYRSWVGCGLLEEPGNSRTVLVLVLAGGSESAVL